MSLGLDRGYQRRPNKPLGGSPNDQLRLGEATPESVETLRALNVAARFGDGGEAFVAIPSRLSRRIMQPRANS
jgi:hypothetical protein